MAIDDAHATPTQASVRAEAKAANKAASTSPGTPSVSRAAIYM
jgi:hypothetical protein